MSDVSDRTTAPMRATASQPKLNSHALHASGVTLRCNSTGSRCWVLPPNDRTRN